MAKRTPKSTGTPESSSQSLAVRAQGMADLALSRGIAAKFNAMKTNDMNWQAEKMYAFQIINNSDSLQQAVVESPHTLVSAMLTASRLGLTLDPSAGLVYLIPERVKAGAPMEVHAKVSYKGMEQTVLTSGTIKDITTELVYTNDTFERGVSENGPYVKFTMARGERGDLEGGFCMARYSNGGFHVEWMSFDDIAACEDAAKRKNFGKLPFTWSGGFRTEMQKKVIVRRAAKHWPRDAVIERVMQQFDAETELDFTESTAVEVLSDAHIEELQEILVDLPKDRQAAWLRMKAEAEGYESIRDVPVELFEKVKNDLATRLKKVNDKAKGTATKEEGAEVYGDRDE